MRISRRAFIREGVAAVTVGVAAPAFLSDLARAQGTTSRSLVVLYLSGGNDGLSTLIPYTDSFYYSRRPTLAVPAGSVLQIGTDAARTPLGLHPRLTGLREIFDAGHLAVIQRTGYANSSRSHFQGTDIWGSASPALSQSDGWLGRYLDTLPRPVDALRGWNTTRETPRALASRTVAVPAIPDARAYSFSSPNSGTAATDERTAALRMAGHLPANRPQLAFVNSTSLSALATLDRVAAVANYQGTVTYPNNGLALALRTVAGTMVRGTGTTIFWVQTGGFDTHAQQGANAGAYVTLMATVGDSVLAFYNDLRNQGLLGSTLVVLFSEFGRRISENGSQGTDHGAAGVMMTMGGAVRGGLYGTAASLNPDPQNPQLENSGGDVRFETDFRAVYARVLEQWLGTPSVPILGGDFRAGAPTFL
ncbi:MAG: DUF1501 domain-containing protein [Acidimicrobiia bacterium]|nr:DUF1501 domain-containing protein [Acidimicrobiia bacterium]